MNSSGIRESNSKESFQIRQIFEAVSQYSLWTMSSPYSNELRWLVYSLYAFMNIPIQFSSALLSFIRLIPSPSQPAFTLKFSFQVLITLQLFYFHKVCCVYLFRQSRIQRIFLPLQLSPSTSFINDFSFTGSLTQQGN